MSSGFDKDWYNRKLAEQRSLKGANATPIQPSDEREDVLHFKIMEYCDAKHPKWKYIRARSDKKSTIQVGAQDITIFASEKRVFCFECKRPGKHPTTDQLVWHIEMELLGHKVHVITSYEEFINIINQP